MSDLDVYSDSKQTGRDFEPRNVIPGIGEMVRVRTRRWLVEDVTAVEDPDESARVRLACADDDAQGQELEVFWDCELDRAILQR